MSVCQDRPEMGRQRQNRWFRSKDQTVLISVRPSPGRSINSIFTRYGGVVMTGEQLMLLAPQVNNP